MTRDTLSERAGIARRTLSRLTGDHVEPTLSQIRDIAKVLEVKPEELVRQ